MEEAGHQGAYQTLITYVAQFVRHAWGEPRQPNQNSDLIPTQTLGRFAPLEAFPTPYTLRGDNCVEYQAIAHCT